MMNTLQLNRLSKCTSLCNRNLIYHKNFSGIKRTAFRALCYTIHAKQFHECKQHRDLLCSSNLVPVPLWRRHATTISSEVSESGFIKRWVKKLGWLDHSRSKLKRSGYLLYESIGEKTNAIEFFEVCELPDTFFSWFLITELHIWLLMTRLMAEGEEGKYTRSCLVEALWEDVETRAKKLGDSSATVRKDQISDLVQSFQLALFTYDEGLLSNDRVLASALWRRLFLKECNDPERIECCVHYIRKQVAYLDTLSREDILLEARVDWLPLLDQEQRK